jgi:N-acetylneuraminic acid mutarotase
MRLHPARMATALASLVTLVACADMPVAPVAQPSDVSALLTNTEAKQLRLTYMCGNRFRVRNPFLSTEPVTWDVYNTTDTATISLPGRHPNAQYSETFFTTTITGTVRLKYNGIVVQTKANGNFACPAAPSWALGPSMTTGRGNNPAVASLSGLIAVIGGFDGGSADIASLETFDPTANAWSTQAAMPIGLYAINGAQSVGSKLYVFGGFRYPQSPRADTYEYDLLTNTWSAKAANGVAGGCGGAGVNGTVVYVLVGCTSGTAYTAKFSRYDTGLNTWDTLAPPASLHVYPAVAASGGKIYVAGGVSNSSNAVSAVVEVFDAALGTWSQLPPMPTARYSAAAAFISGKLYVVGGRTLGGTLSSVTDVFDPATYAWSTISSAPRPWSDGGGAVVGGKFFLAAGHDNITYASRSLAILTP